MKTLTRSVSAMPAFMHESMKCQYKTGKCLNERTRKRNGSLHSLCEEHRIKQNLIQRKSDRKYQKIHAMRRRERSQRKAALYGQRALVGANAAAKSSISKQLESDHNDEEMAMSVAPPSFVQVIKINASGSNASSAMGEPHPSPTSMDEFAPQSHSFPMEVTVSVGVCDKDVNQRHHQPKETQEAVAACELLINIEPIMNPEEADAITLGPDDLEFLTCALF